MGGVTFTFSLSASQRFRISAFTTHRHHPLCRKGRRGSQHALRSKANPIGVAAYQLQSNLPGELKGKLPTAQQLADIVRVEMAAKS